MLNYLLAACALGSGDIRVGGRQRGSETPLQRAQIVTFINPRPHMGHMTAQNPFPHLPITEFLDTLLPDLVLAFAFFTALAYSVLGKRLDHQRAAIAVSATVGIALSVGLVWWEQRVGLTIRDLGPIAVGFAIIIVAFVMYHALRQVGGSWAGAGIAFGTSLLVSKLFGLGWMLDPQMVHTAITVALVVGVLAFMMHRNRHAPALAGRTARLPDVRHDMRDLEQGRRLSNRLGRRFRKLGQRAEDLHEHPAETGDVLLQLKRMLPAEGWLTERLARLREKAHRMRQGQVARIEEIGQQAAKLPVSAKKQLSEQLRQQYREVGLELRLERLDRAAAEVEKRIRDITRQAEQASAAYDFRKLHGLMEAGEKLQKHNSSLFKTIERTEKKLDAAARKAAKNAEVSGA